MANRYNNFIIITLILVFSAGMVWLRARKEEVREALAAQDRAKQISQYTFGLRQARSLRTDPFESSTIGGLSKNSWWAKSLPLAPAQHRALTDLDKLIEDVGRHSSSTVADYLDTQPLDFKEHVNRLIERMAKARYAAERMTALGLLTEPQATLVLQRTASVSGAQRLYKLLEPDIGKRLGVTPEQERRLKKIAADVAANADPPQKFFITDQKLVQLHYKEIEEKLARIEAEAMAVLTPEQVQRWAALTARRTLPPTPPDLPPLPAATAPPEALSPLFAALEGVGLSTPQREFVARLEAITRQGLSWISLTGRTDARGEFIRYAEQFALFGILTQDQAAQVMAAVR